MGWNEGEARGLAAERHALIDRATVAALGGSDAATQRRIANATWTRLHPGIYYLNVTDPTWHSQTMAAVLAAGPHAWASHRSAARLWGLDGVGSSMIEVTVPYTKGPVPANILVHRTRRNLTGVLVEAIPTTTVERTVLDLAAILPESVLEKAVSSAVRLRLTTPEQVAEMISEMGGRGVRGTRRLRRVVERVEYDRTGSSAEVDMMRLIRSLRISQPECQRRISFPDGSSAYPDFAWPDRMKIVEVDGFEAHGSPEALKQDLIRQNKLLSLGWQIRRYSAALIRRDPEHVIGDLRRFIEGI